ncbi:MAG: hypothetical protein O7150_06225 [Wolbachia endosymbiont of Andrena praecox]|nr:MULTISPECIES: hypothetical protein [unclassified Wolbachia]MDX5488343.1 hypothetical protein [Wolbachia endosymbiont of Andrena praecox]MDX5496420.1 hypothetical protein [Wolbachia endosymbiont of Nomada fabriciana]MDX5526843.1 hypothetical protein [Wolbachia endosymbiont of Andrena nigroaenea]MDX5528103.1 hypothetical protein [Wolbachia endosymbiont of Andrena minutula]MDX5543411.1 hypothetical protein [Wolbachia endosymbiont of Andrena apicata]
MRPEVISESNKQKGSWVKRKMKIQEEFLILGEELLGKLCS